ncbi:MAG: SPOR domain-containing protein, partial [Proteobacteria bacterium]|nr:SPOR domain-containing protein [Pseudomonadota bacterium]
YAMGQIIRMGLVSGANEAEALGWYEMAAAQGDKKAQAQAGELRKTGVKPRAPGGKTAAKMSTKTPTKTAAKTPAPPAPEPEPTAVKPKPGPEPGPAPAPTQVAATPPTPGPPAPGPYRIWLISLKDQAEAGRYLRAAQAKHPEIFAQAPGAVARSDLGKAGVVHRVVAGGLSSRQAARDLCRRLRAEEPGAFCKVLAN